MPVLMFYNNNYYQVYGVFFVVVVVAVVLTCLLCHSVICSTSFELKVWSFDTDQKKKQELDHFSTDCKSAVKTWSEYGLTRQHH